MASGPVVEHFDIIKNISPDHVPGFIDPLTSRGERCLSPLSQDTGFRLFPRTAIRQSERIDKRITCRIDRQKKPGNRVWEAKQRRYQQRLAQARICLQFHTPLTVAEWYAQQRDHDFYESDLLRMVLKWLPQFESCKSLEPSWYWNDPLWLLFMDISVTAKGATPEELSADKLVVPNRLPVN